MPGDPRYYLAAERTFLAWIRTGLAMMGLGFVIARFGLFLHEIQSTQPNLPLRNYGLSFWFGTGLILLGAVVNVASAMSHVETVRKIRLGESEFDQPSRLGLGMAGLLALTGIGMAIYLVSVR